MKRKFTILLAAAVLLVGLAACRKEAPHLPAPDNAVEISVSIADTSPSLRLNSLADTGAAFEAGDELFVIARGSSYNASSVYRLDQEGKWAPASDDEPHLLWMEDNLLFLAAYPGALVRSCIEAQEGDGRNWVYAMPTDQSTPEKLAAADFMLSEVTGTSFSKGGGLFTSRWSAGW